MALYISIALFLMFGFIIELKSNRKEATYTTTNSIAKRENNSSRIQKLFFFIFIFVLWFLTAFRSEKIGSDTIAYIKYFKDFSTNGIFNDSRIETGYQILNILVSKISNNPQFFLGFVATICYVGTGIYIYKYSDNIVFSTVLLFPVAYGFFATGLRQAIAMIICLYAYQAIKNQKNICAILLVALASTFHTSAWIVLILLLHKFIPKKPKFVISLTAIFITLSLTGIMDEIFVLLLGNRYGGYYENEIVTNGWLGIAYYCVRNFVFYMVVFLSYKNKEQENSVVLSLFTMLLITISFGFSISLFSRATYYFMLMSLVELPNAIYRGTLKNKKLLTFLIGFVMVLYFMVTLIIRPEWNNLYPYEFYWN